MIEQICAYIHNYFERTKTKGTYHIVNGVLIDSPVILTGQYLRIQGSALNDGVYLWPVTGLADETFDGTITAMAVPPALINIAEEIEAWQEKYGQVMDSPYQSESFDGYSYTKGNGNSSGTVTGSDWRSVFGSRLNQWRKLA